MVQVCVHLAKNDADLKSERVDLYKCERVVSSAPSRGL